MIWIVIQGGKYLIVWERFFLTKVSILIHVFSFEVSFYSIFTMKGNKESVIFERLFYLSKLNRSLEKFSSVEDQKCFVGSFSSMIKVLIALFQTRLSKCSWFIIYNVTKSMKNFRANESIYILFLSKNWNEHSWETNFQRTEQLRIIKNTIGVVCSFQLN